MHLPGLNRDVQEGSEIYFISQFFSNTKMNLRSLVFHYGLAAFELVSP